MAQESTTKTYRISQLVVLIKAKTITTVARITTVRITTAKTAARTTTRISRTGSIRTTGMTTTREGLRAASRWAGMGDPTTTHRNRRMIRR